MVKYRKVGDMKLLVWENNRNGNGRINCAKSRQTEWQVYTERFLSYFFTNFEVVSTFLHVLRIMIHALYLMIKIANNKKPTISLFSSVNSRFSMRIFSVVRWLTVSSDSISSRHFSSCLQRLVRFSISSLNSCSVQFDRWWCKKQDKIQIKKKGKKARIRSIGCNKRLNQKK